MRHLLPVMAGALLICLLPGCKKPEPPVEIAEWQCADDMMSDDDGAPLDFSAALPDAWWPRPVCLWHSGLDVRERVPARFDAQGRLVDFELPEGDFVMRLWVLDGDDDPRRHCTADDGPELGWPVHDIADEDVALERVDGLDQATCGESRCCRAALCGQYLWTWDDDRLRRHVVSMYRPCSGAGCSAGAMGQGQVCDTWQADARCVPRDTVPCPLAPGAPGCTYAAPDHEVICDEDGLWPACTTPVEACDGADQDCDGVADEGFDLNTDVLNCGACGVVCEPRNAEPACVDGGCAVAACDAGSWDLDGDPSNGCEYDCEPGDARAEICNGIDDDCDGLTDEEVLGVGAECVVGQGICTHRGRMECAVVPMDGAGPGGGEQDLTCDVTPGDAEDEVCNGLDDDCDGTVDDVMGIDLPCEAGVGACLAAGTWACGAERGSGVAIDLHCTAEQGQPTEEVCNGIDDDCDGVVDDDPVGVGDWCTLAQGESPEIVGRCRTGQMVCANGDLECGLFDPAETERCDAADWDCDGEPHNGFDVGLPCSDGVGECRREGRMVCDGIHAQRCDAQAGPAGIELCDGLDNDCDEGTDETWPELSDPCTVGRGACATAGERVCAPAGDETTCSVEPSPPSAETCNGIDDDCDGEIDEIVPRPCGSDVGACEMGIETCRDGAWSPCEGARGPSPEVCNDVDDDCNGLVDDHPETERLLSRDCYSGAEGTADVGLCHGGISICQGGQYGRCDGQITPMPERCNHQDDDCDGETDEDFELETDDENCGACGAQCERVGARVSCVDGECVFGGCRRGHHDANGDPSDGCECRRSGPEICDGQDNDCNGAVDDHLFDEPACVYRAILSNRWRCSIHSCQENEQGHGVACDFRSSVDIHDDVPRGDAIDPEDAALEVCQRLHANGHFEDD